MTRYQVRFLEVPRWLAILAGALAVGFAVALFLLSLTVFLLALPVIAVAGVLYYLFGMPRATRATRSQPRGEIIEGEYRVVEPGSINDERQRK
jgi:hypothetical protein